MFKPAKLVLPFVILLAASFRADATLLDMLGDAGQYAVFSLDGTFQNDSNVTINGDVGVGPNGSASIMAPTTVHGTVFRDSSATVTGPGKIDGGIVVRSLGQAVSDALGAANSFAAFAPTQTFSSLSAGITLAGNGGLNVINITGGINLNGSNNLVLNGNANDQFIFNITGGLQMGGSAKVVLNGIDARNVVFNFVGEGDALMTHVGNMISGVILAPDRDITFHGAFGEIIGGGKTLTLMSGATVEGFAAVPEVAPSSVIFGFLGLLVAVSSRRVLRRRSQAAGIR